MTGRGRGWAWGYAVVTVLIIVVVWWALRGTQVGAIDPLSAVIATVSLMASVASGLLARRAWRWQETDIALLLPRLAAAVIQSEMQARQQLLGGGDKPIDIDFALVRASAHNAAQAGPKGRLRKVVSYYNRLRPRRLAITGEPGSGKTVLAVELILSLLESRAPEDPVPVRLSASSLDVSTGETVDVLLASGRVERWLTAHLTDTYRLTARSARQLVVAQKVLPVIDGLDEMDADEAPSFASRAGVTLQILNAYQQHRAKAELVITCRSEQYQALTAAHAQIQDAARVEISPITSEKARAFVAGRVTDLGRWDAVLRAVNRSSCPLAQGLSTPWRLTLAVTVYEQRHPDGAFIRHPDQLTDPALNSPDAVRDHLLALFIPAAAALRTSPKAARYRPSADEVHRWLAVLALYLNDNAINPKSLGGRTLSSTDIVLHELWPLAGPRRVRAVCLGMLIVLWLIGTPMLLQQDALALILLVVLALYAACQCWAFDWPNPSKADLSQLRTGKGRWKFVGWFAIGLTFGLAMFLAFGLAAGIADLPVAGIVKYFAFSFVIAIPCGLTIGLVLGLGTIGINGTRDPRSIAHVDLALGLALGLAMGLVYGLLRGFGDGLTTGLASGISNGFAYGLTSGLAVGLTLGFARVGPGLVGFRYIALLLCTRRRSPNWLPWRLGRSIDWCYHAGLLRIAGIGYQFRHRELQDYLARYPAPQPLEGERPPNVHQDRKR